MNFIGTKGLGPFGYRREQKHNFFIREQVNRGGKIILVVFLIMMGCGGTLKGE